MHGQLDGGGDEGEMVAAMEEVAAYGEHDLAEEGAFLHARSAVFDAEILRLILCHSTAFLRSRHNVIQRLPCVKYPCCSLPASYPRPYSTAHLCDILM
jgi:hypothetical protein